MSRFKHLFQPISIGSLAVPNRIAMLGCSMGYSEDSRPGIRDMDYYTERAKGGVGLLFIGIIYPCDMGDHEPMSMTIHDDSYIAGLRKLTDAIHAHGSKAVIQLGLRYEWRKGPGFPKEYVGASELQPPGDLPKCRPLTVEEIHQLVDQFGAAANRSRQAGFDGIEILSGAGYAISNFMSAYANKRTDEYGGSVENRMRLLKEIIAAIKKQTSSDYPLIVRFSIDETVPGGTDVEMARVYARMLEDFGVHAIDSQFGRHEAPTPLVQASIKPGGWVEKTAALKSAIKIPIIAAYRINTPELAEEIIASGKADMVGIARAVLADPYWPRKARENRPEDIVPCITCSNCISLAYYHKPITCPVNPVVGLESKFPVSPAKKRRKVCVIGGGPAGIEAAALSAERGHEVILLESRDCLGGQLNEASKPPFKEDVKRYLNYVVTRAKKSGATIKLGVNATVESVLKMRPDAVVVATGALPLCPKIPGIEGKQVVTAVDALRGAEVGCKIVVIGGGLLGCEVAEFLAERGKQVTIIEMLPRIGAQFSPSSRWVNIRRLRAAGVRMEANTTAAEVSPSGVKVKKENGPEEFLEADTVLLASGMCSQDGLYKELQGKVPELHLVGDGRQPRSIAEAVSEAFHVARSI